MDNIFEKADFSAGSDHKERLRKQLFNKGGIPMKLTEELKGKLENASEEEAKKILEETKKEVEEAGVILDDAELDKAAGGGGGYPQPMGKDIPFI